MADPPQNQVRPVLLLTLTKHLMVGPSMTRVTTKDFHSE